MVRAPLGKDLSYVNFIHTRQYIATANLLIVSPSPYQHTLAALKPIPISHGTKLSNFSSLIISCLFVLHRWFHRPSFYGKYLPTRHMRAQSTPITARKDDFFFSVHHYKMETIGPHVQFIGQVLSDEITAPLPLDGFTLEFFSIQKKVRTRGRKTHPLRNLA